MKAKINRLFYSLLVVSASSIVTSCGGDDDPKKPSIPEVYFISYETELIQKFSSDDPENITTFLDVAGFSGSGLAYDATHDKIYFADFWDYYVGKIWTIDSDGTAGDEEAIVEDLYEPWAVAIDEAGGKIYYTDGADLDDVDYDESHIYRANLDGSGATPVVTMEGALFRPLAIDPANNKMYFYDVELENLYMANLDGSNQQVILEGAYGYAIAVDTKNDKIYFDDQNSNGGDGALLMDNLDGTYPLTPVTVDNTASRIYGIAIDNENNKLYWSARDNNAIYKADLNGSNKITLTDAVTEPRGLILKK